MYNVQTVRLDRFSSAWSGKRKRDGEEERVGSQEKRLVHREERLVYMDWIHRYDAPLPQVTVDLIEGVYILFNGWESSQNIFVEKLS